MCERFLTLLTGPVRTYILSTSVVPAQETVPNFFSFVFVVFFFFPILVGFMATFPQLVLTVSVEQALLATLAAGG